MIDLVLFRKLRKNLELLPPTNVSRTLVLEVVLPLTNLKKFLLILPICTRIPTIQIERVVNREGGGRRRNGRRSNKRGRYHSNNNHEQQEEEELGI